MRSHAWHLLDSYRSIGVLEYRSIGVSDTIETFKIIDGCLFIEVLEGYRRVIEDALVHYRTLLKTLGIPYIRHTLH